MTSINENLLAQLVTEEGLLRCNLIKLTKNEFIPPYIRLTLAQNPSFEIFPHPEISGVLQFLSNNEEMWEQAALAVNTEDWGQKRAPVFGVSFDKALKMAAKECSHKAIFSIHDPKKYSGLGYTADICFFVRKVLRDQRHIFEFQAWQFLRPEYETFYVHGEIERHTNNFIHLDGAKIELTEDKVNQILYSKERPKGPKIKLFRIYGSIEYYDAISIIKEFFPIEELSDEAFNFTKM